MAEATKIRDPKVKSIFQLFENTGYDTHFINPHSSIISALNNRCNDNIADLEALLAIDPIPTTYNPDIEGFITILEGVIADSGSITTHHTKLLKNYTTLLSIAVSYGENKAALDESDPVDNFQGYFDTLLKDIHGGLLPDNITYLNGVLTDIETQLAPLAMSMDLTQQIIDSLAIEFNKLGTPPNNMNNAIASEVNFFGAPILDGPFENGPAMSNLTNFGIANKIVALYKDQDLAPFFDGTLSPALLSFLDGA